MILQLDTRCFLDTATGIVYEVEPDIEKMADATVELYGPGGASVASDGIYERVPYYTLTSGLAQRMFAWLFDQAERNMTIPAALDDLVKKRFPEAE